MKTKTSCCNADVYAKGQADFRCRECDRDVSMEIRDDVMSISKTVKRVKKVANRKPTDTRIKF